jgi:hypothetical protein
MRLWVTWTLAYTFMLVLLQANIQVCLIVSGMSAKCQVGG